MLHVALTIWSILAVFSHILL